MSSNGKPERTYHAGSVKPLVVIASPEYDRTSRGLVSIVTGAESVHVARGPWSAQTREVVTIIGRVGCMDTTLKALEVASGNGARFYLVARVPGEAEPIEAWSTGNAQVFYVGVDCDDELPGSLAACRDEARAIACTSLLADAMADIGSAIARGNAVCAVMQGEGVTSWPS
jgi:hypothetical protein